VYQSPEEAVGGRDGQLILHILASLHPFLDSGTIERRQTDLVDCTNLKEEGRGHLAKSLRNAMLNGKTTKKQKKKDGLT